MLYYIKRMCDMSATLDIAHIGLKLSKTTMLQMAYSYVHLDTSICIYIYIYIYARTAMDVGGLIHSG